MQTVALICSLLWSVSASSECVNLNAAWREMGGGTSFMPSTVGTTCCSEATSKSSNYYVLCDTDTDSNLYITTVSWVSQNLKGDVSQSLLKLMHLQKLYLSSDPRTLSNNLLTGSIPSFEELTNLWHL